MKDNEGMADWVEGSKLIPSDPSRKNEFWKGVSSLAIAQKLIDYSITSVYDASITVSVLAAAIERAQ